MILISSFDNNVIKQVRQIDPYVKLGAMSSGSLKENLAFAEFLDAFSIHKSLRSVNKKFVDIAHLKGFRVYVYTVNQPEDIKKMNELGVDGIFTDYPERVIKCRNNKYKKGWF